MYYAIRHLVFLFSNFLPISCSLQLGERIRFNHERFRGKTYPSTFRGAKTLTGDPQEFGEEFFSFAKVEFLAR